MTHLRVVNGTDVYVAESAVVARAAVRNVRARLLASSRVARDLAELPVFDEKRVAFLRGMAEGQRDSAKMLKGLDG